MEEEKGKFKNLIIFGLIAVAIVAIFLFVLLKDSKYRSLGESMVATAKSHVLNNKIVVNGNTYVTLEQMGFTNIYDCNKASGVSISIESGLLKYEAYLVCDNYLSSNLEHNKGKYIKLNGANPYIIESGVLFEDPGYSVNNGYRVETATDYQSKVGVYTVSYYVYKDNVRSEVAVRTIIVSNIASNDAPVITLNGESNVILKVGNIYTEPGYVAIDQTDGNITSKVRVDNKVKTSVVGEYEIVYSVTNSNGLKTSKKRVVSIVPENLNIYTYSSITPETATNGKVLIKLKNIGNTYDFTIRPDGSRRSTTDVEYEVSENGLYIFKIHDKSGNIVNKNVLIDNIDSVSPTGSCEAVSKGGVVTYSVVSDDDSSGVAGISYYTGFEYSSYSLSSKAQYNMNYLEAKVMIKDSAGNITKIDCTGKKVSTIDSVSIPTTKTINIGSTYTIPLTLNPTNANTNELVWSIVSGSNYITLDQTGKVNAVSAGTAVVKVSVKDSELYAQIVLTIKKQSIVVEPGGDTNVDAECGKKAQTLKAYYNGSQIERYSKIKIGVGETIRITMYLETKCGTIKLLTRNTADGQTGWQDYISASSDPQITRDDPSTYVATDHFDWVITGVKSTGGREIHLSQTTFQATSAFLEIKSFFNVYITVE